MLSWEYGSTVRSAPRRHSQKVSLLFSYPSHKSDNSDGLRANSGRTRGGSGSKVKRQNPVALAGSFDRKCCGRFAPGSWGSAQTVLKLGELEPVGRTGSVRSPKPAAVNLPGGRRRAACVTPTSRFGRRCAEGSGTASVLVEFFNACARALRPPFFTNFGVSRPLARRPHIRGVVPSQPKLRVRNAVCRTRKRVTLARTSLRI